MASPYQETEMTEPSDLVLSPEEIYAITHYKVPKKQLAALQEMGIPARGGRRPAVEVFQGAGEEGLRVRQIVRRDEASREAQ